MHITLDVPGMWEGGLNRCSTRIEMCTRNEKMDLDFAFLVIKLPA